MKFGDILRRLLEEREMPQKRLAADLKLSAQTIGHYINHEREPDIETIKTIAKYFNVSADYLLNMQSGKVDTQNENEILRIFRSLTKEQQDLYIEQGRAFIRLSHKEKAKSS